MKTTRTGNFTIGFRRGGSQWQRDLSSLIEWAKGNDFGAIDLGQDAVESAPQVVQAGLKVGTVDLLDWQGIISPDSEKRQQTVQRNAAYIEALSSLGAMNYFVVMLPSDPKLPRKENFAFMVESFTALAPTLEKHSARIAIEGWPGPGALCCTPEGFRAFFEQCPSSAMGINYDPSHLIRMGIDPLRFLGEFTDRVAHVHGKDTDLLSEGVYEYGTELPATFARPIGFGAFSWRYTIPGHGIMRWSEAFRILNEAGYKGSVCVELEDAHFNGTEEGEQTGLLASLNYLESC